jgi:hypothetical protein
VVVVVVVEVEVVDARIMFCLDQSGGPSVRTAFHSDASVSSLFHHIAL